MFFAEPILALETSCDETSAAVIHRSEILSNVIASQIDLHQKWGGVVPEAAARAHVEAVIPVIEEALVSAGLTMRSIKGVGVTNRPGLVGALSVGVTAAKALAFANQIPLIGIHHLEGHIASIFGAANLPSRKHLFPLVALIASGGHTELVLVQAIGDYTILGETIDDAAGEAFDKGARAMGLPYPGGLAIQEAAKTGNPLRYPLPQGLTRKPQPPNRSTNKSTNRPLQEQETSHQPDHSLNFSFSGLKTAVLRLVETQGPDLSIPDAAASLQRVIVDVLSSKSIAACQESGCETFGLVGGVAANLALRSRLEAECQREGIRFVTPPLRLCTDNAAMIGLAASIRLARGESSNFSLPTLPNEPLGGAGWTT